MKNKSVMSPHKKPKTSKKMTKLFLAKMAECENMEALNDNVLIPFISALEEVTEARGYILNIYGAKSNLVVSNKEDSEPIYGLVEKYLDSRVEGALD